MINLVFYNRIKLYPISLKLFFIPNCPTIRKTIVYEYVCVCVLVYICVCICIKLVYAI